MSSELTAVLNALESISKVQAEQAKTLSDLCSNQNTLSKNQSTLSTQLQASQEALAAILKALSKEPSAESLRETMVELLKPLDGNMKLLVTSFNKLQTVAEALSTQLPPPRSTSKVMQ